MEKSQGVGLVHVHRPRWSAMLLQISEGDFIPARINVTHLTTNIPGIGIMLIHCLGVGDLQSLDAGFLP